MQASLASAQADRSRLQSLLDEGAGVSDVAQTRISMLSQNLEEERQLTAKAQSQLALLNQQISALRAQLAAVEEALEISEAKDDASQARIADLGRRLNVALAQKVQELNRYRSDFFGRLRQILSDRENIRVVGDRFVFQSEVLFQSGADELNDDGRAELAKLATALLEIAPEIPEDISWVLRVDGHTDDVPIRPGGQFADNWELSSARANSVVRYLISQGYRPIGLLRRVLRNTSRSLPAIRPRRAPRTAVSSSS
nr:peptidoglycan -binding protein [Marinicella sp. W31]MDC2877961.1 peptidoglycan -binding protein [Marinicella sp. W31]